jgi:ribonuclease E
VTDQPAEPAEPEAAEPETAELEPLAAAEPEAPQTEPEPDDNRPKRTGWWSRKSSFF